MFGKAKRASLLIRQVENLSNRSRISKTGAMRKVLTRKFLKVINFKNMSQSGTDSPPQALGYIEQSSGQRGQVRLGWIRVGLMLRGVLGFSNSRTLLVAPPKRIILRQRHSTSLTASPESPADFMNERRMLLFMKKFQLEPFNCDSF